MTTNVRLAVIGWILVLSGGWLAHAVQTSGGIVIDDVRIELGDGKRLSALLYRPPDATAQHPAPGILAVHGYINSRETQSGFAIEFARRGYVVLAIDQTGHGFSEGRCVQRRLRRSRCAWLICAASTSWMARTSVSKATAWVAGRVLRPPPINPMDTIDRAGRLLDRSGFCACWYARHFPAISGSCSVASMSSPI